MAILDVRVSVSRFGAQSYVVAVGGEVDLYTVEPLRERLAEVLEGGARSVLIDLTGATFIDSTALGVFVNTARALRSSRGQLVLVADDPRILRVMEVTGLDRIFRIRPSLAEGVEELVRQARER